MGLGDSDYGIRISAAHFIGELGSLAADTRGRLISCASDENLDVRIAVAVSLGKIGGAEDVIDALSRMVADENHYVRAAAARALAWYPTITEGAVTALRAGLSASDSLTRDTCAFALAKHRRADAEVTAAVIDGVSTKDAYWAMAAATAMDPVPDAVISPLIAAINSPRANVRRMALHILARLGARLAEHQTELRAALGVEPEVTIEQMRSMLVELAQADGNER
jgi:HEAT repeat protein